MKRILLVSLLFVLVISGCKQSPTDVTPTSVPTIEVTPTNTAVPMALLVNGEGISIDEYNAALKRLQDAQQSINKVNTAQEQRDSVIENFVTEILMAQAAVQNGKVLDDTDLQNRINALIKDIGGEDKLTAWQQRYEYTPETFRASLRRSILLSWQRDEIINAVPTTADQIHARQILVKDEDNAAYAYAQLKTGTDFEKLAFDYDPLLGGDLSWFPQWGLTQQNVADAAFALQPGEYSEVIRSEIGYHIIYVIERDPNHTLSVNMRRMLQEKAILDWLTAAKASSSIEILVN